MAGLRGRINNTDRLARTLQDVAVRATEDPNRRVRRTIASGLPEVEPTDFASRQIVAKDFRTALNVGESAGGVRFNSDGIQGYNSSVVQTIDIGTDGSGFLGVGGTQITWGTSGAVAVPGDALVAGSVTGAKVANDTITSALLKAGAQAYNSTVEFTGTAYNAYSWGSGSIAFGDGATQSINSGSNSGLSNNTTYYVYATIGSATLTQTTTYSDVFSDARVLLAMIVVGTSASGSEPTILPFGSKGLTISAVAISANAITADSIQASAVTATKISVSTLSALSADMGSITAGTVTGATIRSASSGARVEINSSGLAIHGTASTLLVFRPTPDGASTGSIGSHASGIAFNATKFVMTGAAVPGSDDTGALGLSGEAWATARINEITTSLIEAPSNSIQIHSSAGSNTIGFFGVTPAVRQNVSGARDDPEAALADLIASLATLGLITDSTTAS